MSIIKVGAQVLATKLAETSRRIFVQLGSVSGDVHSQNAEWMQHIGFASMPSNPEKGKAAASTVTVEDGGKDVVVASQDNRALEIYGNLKPGDTCVYGAGPDGKGQACTLWRGDGAVTNYTTEGNIKGGRAIYARVGPGIDEETGAPDGFSWAAPWGTMKFDWTGFHIVTESGAEFHLGGISGMPPPLDAISSYCNIQAGTFSTTASGQSLGAGPTQPLAFSTPLLAHLASLQALLTAIHAAIGTIPSGGSAAAAAIAPLLTQATASLAAATAAIPAGTSSSV